MIHRDPSLFRTLAMTPRALRPIAHATAEAIAAEVPHLPAPTDELFVVPPGVRRWRRRVGASSWWVVYSWVPETETLILRTVNELP